MKRTMPLFLSLLMLVATLGTAEAKTKPKAKPTKAKPAAVKEMTNSQEESEEREGKKPIPAPRIPRERKQAEGGAPVVGKPGAVSAGAPVELHLTKASSRKFDLRLLPHTPPVARDRNELPDPPHLPSLIGTSGFNNIVPESIAPRVPVRTAAAPPPIAVYEGLDRQTWGAGSPPDTNGDVGPNHYIQTVNTSLGIYDKSGNLINAFTFNTFMSQGNFGNLCDTNNFGDPVVLYDTFEDRWVITDFAFLQDASLNVLAPAYQCFAVSMTGDPVSGGWNFYSTQINDALNDYPKLGVWTDGIYMSANMFSFGAGSSFVTARAWAFNKAQMYAGAPSVQVVQFNIPGGDFAVMPSNARLQTGTPPPGRPNLFVSTWQFLNAITVYKFHVDWNSIGLSTFTGPDAPLAATSWPNAAVANAPQSGTTNLLDVLQIRAMVQNQYTNFGGVESLWIPHTVRRANTTGFAAPRFYQADVTGGTVAANLVQAVTSDPDGANVMHRFMPSLALDRAGNMMMGYSTSSLTTFPSIKYAGRLAGDAANSQLSQTEQVMFSGTASQLTSTRWGDYSSMTLDPDGCTFWYTTEYATGLDVVSPTDANKRWRTKFGKMVYPPGTCTPVGAGGTVSGSVTTNPGGSPIAGATVMLGSRTAVTDGSGNYSFSPIPAGVYPSMTASFPGYIAGSASNISVTDGNTTTQNFSLTAAPTNACPTDTTQSDFLAGVATATLDLTTSPGDITLSNAPALDQQNTAGTTTGTGFGTPAWTGQTFIAGVSGNLVKAEGTLFCNGCGATPPNLTLSLRATAAGLPTGADLASTTISGSLFASGASTTFTAIFGAPAAVAAGTQYALILRPVSAPAGSGYFWIRSSPSTYASGSRVLSADSGATWSADTTRDYNFKTYVQTGYAASGDFTSRTFDSNPLAGLTPVWTTLSWTATTPANTSIQFQVAGSNNPNGPFTFIGPDGTAGTFFTTSPASLAQFYGLRYLKYKAYFATSNSAVTPTLSDVTACFADTDCSAGVTITPGAANVCTNSTGNTASGPAGATSYAWSITNGTITSATNIQTITFTAGASGTVDLQVNVVTADGCHRVGNVSIPITVVPQPTITPQGPTTFCTGGSVTLQSDSATGNQWYLNGNPVGGATSDTYLAAASGDYTVQVTSSGCASPMSAIVTVTINTAPPIPTIAGTTNGTGTQDQACPEVPLTLTATSAGATSFQWYKDIDLLPGETNATYQATGSATYYVTATVNGCTSATSAGYVVQNPTPHSPFVSFRGQASTVTTLAICAGSSQIIDSDSATGIHWWKDGVDLGPGSQSLTVTTAGVYTAQLNALGCHSQFGRNVTVVVNALPPTPTITPGGPTTFCAGGSVTLTSDSATGNQWYLNGNPIGGATNQTYNATASGNYTVKVTDGNNCTSAASNTVSVTVNPLPATPTITPGGPTSFCPGGSVTLTSSSATGNQWYLNGNPIGGATGTTYIANATGDYTVVVTDGNGCVSAASAATHVTVNPNPDATITAPGSVTTASTGNVASVANAGGGATYNWSITNGTITGGTGTNSITFTAGAVGPLTLQVTVTTAAGCSDTKSALVTVGLPAVTVTSVVPNKGTYKGGTAITINGTGFAVGATVTLGGTPATSVVRVSSIKLTAVTPAHALGAVNVVVTNPDTSNGTLTNGYTYIRQFDPNNDSLVDPSDIFYLVKYIFDSGPAPAGPAGPVASGDANNDHAVDPADIFYLINYLYLGGPNPASIPGGVSAQSVGRPLGAELSLGAPVVRDGRTHIPVILTLTRGSDTPQSFAVKVDFNKVVNGLAIRRAGAAKDATVGFEISRTSAKSITWIASFDERTRGLALAGDSAVIAEIELTSATRPAAKFDASVTTLGDSNGTRAASVSRGNLTLSGTPADDSRIAPKGNRNE